MKKILNKSGIFIFFIAIGLNILLLLTWFLILPHLGNKSELLMYLFMALSVFPNFLLLIVFYRIIKSILREIIIFIKFISPAIALMISKFFNIFSDKNLGKVENIIKKNQSSIDRIMKNMNIEKKEINLFWIAPIIVLLIGLFPLPIGYYMISRLVVSGCALYFLINLYKQNDNFKVWIFGFIVVLYNPLIPIYLNEKILWVLVNIPTMYYFYINQKSIKK